MRRIGRYHPILWLLGLTLALYGTWGLAHLPYDDNGTGTVLFVLMYALMQPFWLAFALVYRVLGPEPTLLKGALAWAIGIALYVLVDQALTRWARRDGMTAEAT